MLIFKAIVLTLILQVKRTKQDNNNGGKDTNAKHVYQLKGETVTTIDLSDDYFNNGLDLASINVTNSNSSEIINVTKMSDSGLTANSSNQTKFDVRVNGPVVEINYKREHPLIGVNDVNSDNETLTLEKIVKKNGYRIRQVDTRKFVETHIIEKPDVNDPNGGKLKFLKMTLLEYKMDKKKLDFVDNEEERYDCVNHCPNGRNHLSHFGRLMEIVYSEADGYLKHCFSFPKPTKNSQNTGIPLILYFQLDNLAFKGFVQKGIKKPIIITTNETLADLYPQQSHNQDDNSTQTETDSLQSHCVILNYYEDLEVDAIFYLKDKSYIFYNKDPRTNTDHEFNAGVISINKYFKISDIKLIGDKFLVIVGKQKLIIESGQGQDNIEEWRVRTKIYEIKNSRSGKVTQSNRNNGIFNGQPNHFLNDLDDCIAENNNADSTANQECFVLDEEGQFSNFYRQPSDFGIVIEIIPEVNDGYVTQAKKAEEKKLQKKEKDQKRNNKIKVLKWDEKSKKFHTMIEDNLGNFTIVDRFVSSDYFINIIKKQSDDDESMKIKNVTNSSTLEQPYVYHSLEITQRSYNSKGIDQKLMMKSRYKDDAEIKKNSINSNLFLGYFFDPVNALLFRRGARDLEVFSFVRPSLGITSKEEKISGKDENYIIDCKRDIVKKENLTISLSYKNPKEGNKLMKSILKFYSDPLLKIGSILNTNFTFSKTEEQFPTGYQLKKHSNNFVIGSFLKIENTMNSGNQNQSNQVSMSTLREYNYKIKYAYDPSQFESMYTLLIENRQGKLILNLVMSDLDGNALFSGDYHQPSKNITLDRKMDFFDFRKISYIETMRNSTTFIQIDALSYYINLESKNFTFKPWEGINGVCSKSIKIQHNLFGPTVVCFYKKLFFVKYLGSGGTTITRQIRLGYHVKLFLDDAKIEYGELMTSNELQNNFMMIYKKQNSLGSKAVFFELSGNLYPLIQKVADFDLPMIKKSEDEEKKFSGTILEMKLAGRYLIYLVGDETESQSSYIISRIEQNLNFTFLKFVKLPKEIKFSSNSKSHVSQIEDKVNEKSQSKLDLGRMRYLLASKVSVIEYKKQGDIQRRYSLLILNPQVEAINSLNLVEIDSDYKFLEFGPLFSEKSTSREVYYSILAKHKRVLIAEKGDKTSHKNHTIFLTNDLSYLVKFSVDQSANEVISQGGQRDSNQTYSFQVMSTLLNQSSQENVAVRNYCIENVTVSHNFKYSKWFDEFNVTDELIAVKSDFKKDIKSKSTNKTISLNLSNNGLHSEGDGLFKFIKLDPSNYTIGNIVDIFGYIDSNLETALEIVVIPNNNGPDVQSKSKCFTPMKGMNTSISVWCNHKLDSKDRLEHGCSGRGYISKYDTYDGLNKNQARIWTHSSESINYYSLAKNKSVNVKDDYTDVASSTKIRSQPILVENYFWFIETRNNSGLFDFFIYDMNEVERMGMNKFINKAEDAYKFQNNLKYGKDDHIEDYNSVFGFSYKTLEGNSTVVDFINSFQKLFLIESSITHVNNSKTRTRLTTHVKIFAFVAVDYNEQTKLYKDAKIYKVVMTKITTQQLNDTKKKNETTTGIKVSSKLAEVQFVADNIDISFINKTSDKNISKIILLTPEWSENSHLHIVARSLDVSKPHSDYNKTITTISKTIIDLGYFKTSDYVYAQKAKIICPNNQSLDFFQNKPKSDSIYFIIEFPLSNDYLIKIDLKDLSQNEATTKTINNFEILPISNPFIGFMPASDSPPSIFDYKYYFHVRSYLGSSYLITYSLDFENLQKIKINSGNDPKNNIFEVTNEKKDQLKNSKKPFYVSSRGVIKLKQRPTAYNVFLHIFGNNSIYEHALVYSNSNGFILTKRFTMQVGIMFKSNKLASNTISVIIQGLHSEYVKVNFEPRGDANKSQKELIISYSKILALFLISIFGALLLIKFVVVSREAADQRKLNTKKKTTASFIGKSLLNLVKKRDIEEDYNNFKYDQNSDDQSSDEESEEDKVVGNMHDYIDESYEEYSDSEANEKRKLSLNAEEK